MSLIVQKSSEYKGVYLSSVADVSISYFSRMKNKTVGFFKFIDLLLIIFGRDYEVSFVDYKEDDEYLLGKAFHIQLKANDSRVSPSDSELADNFLRQLILELNNRVHISCLNESYIGAQTHLKGKARYTHLIDPPDYWPRLEEQITEVLSGFRVDLVLPGHFLGECPNVNTNMAVSVKKFGTTPVVRESKHRVDNCRWVKTTAEFLDVYGGKGCILDEKCLIFLFEKGRHDIEHNMFEFYRDYLSILNTDLRNITENNYVSLLTELVSSSTKQTTVADLVDGLHNLSAATPYSTLQLKTPAELAKKPLVDLIEEEISSLVSYNDHIDKESVKNQIENFDRIGTQGVIKAVRLALLEKTYSWSRISNKEREVFNNIGHILKDVVSITGWNSSVKKTGTAQLLYSQFYELDKEQFKDGIYKHRERFHEAFRFASESLRTFSIVQALGQTISYFKYQNSEADWAKLAALVDDAAYRTVSSDSVLQAMTASIHELASIICQAKNWPLLETKSNLVSYKYEERNHFFDENRYHFPPFKRGSFISYLFYFYVSEPVLNAVKKHSIAMANTNEPIKIELRYVDDQKSDAITFSVQNYSKTKLPSIISGYSNTLELLNSFGLTLDAPKTVSVFHPEKKLWHITVSTTFYPKAMASNFRNLGSE